ncbi:MAG: Ig-like domain-containing protein [Planctomycetota bacterium]|nr:Ig-like domain-containing protein [Planctomycetota bacterium]
MRPPRTSKQARSANHSLGARPDGEPLETRTLLAAIDLAVSTAQPLVTNDTTPALTGTVSEPAADVTVTLLQSSNTVGVWSAQTDGAGGWSFTVPDADALADGSYDLRIEATADGGADSGDLSLSDSLVVDTVKPGVSFDDGQLPATTNADKTLTGTFTDTDVTGIEIALDDGNGHVFDFPAVLDTEAMTWSAAVAIAGVTDGSYTVSATATDLAGNATTIGAAGALTVDATAPAASMATLATTSTQPALSGTVDDANATVTVAVRSTSYTAVNNGDGTWTLAAGQITALPDGTYRVTVTATDTAGNETTFEGARLIVDTTAPKVTVDRLVTAETSPAMSGTINDYAAAVVVTVDGTDYDAVNNGDGTWTLAAGTVTALDQGVYDVTATATDALDNAGTDTTADELTVGTTEEIVLGAGISKITYVDGDGTTVTVRAGTGSVTVSLTGVDLTVGGTGTSRAVSATGGVVQVDVEIAETTSTLTFKAGVSGDGLTEIHQVTGAGTLGRLVGNGVDVVDGIDMTGVIKSTRLHDILSDVTMGDWTNGVHILANAIEGSDIQTGYIRRLTANTFSDSTISVTTLKSLNAKTRFQSTKVTATTIGTAVLWNLAADNGGVSFGLTADTLGSLKLVQGLKLKHGHGRVVLTWGKSFTDGIDDFFVDA